MPAFVSSFGTKIKFLNLPPVSVGGAFSCTSSKEKGIFSKRVFVRCDVKSAKCLPP